MCSHRVNACQPTVQGLFCFQSWGFTPAPIFNSEVCWCFAAVTVFLESQWAHYHISHSNNPGCYVQAWIIGDLWARHQLSEAAAISVSHAKRNQHSWLVQTILPSHTDSTHRLMIPFDMETHLFVQTCLFIFPLCLWTHARGVFPRFLWLAQEETEGQGRTLTSSCSVITSDVAEVNIFFMILLVISTFFHT